jgi:anti-sigma B factor antagonist
MSEKAAASGLTLTVERTSEGAVVRCSGRLVAGISDLLYRQVSQLTPGSKRVVLDFTDLAHMDSMGLGALVRVYVASKSAGCALQVVNIGKPIRQLLGVTHLLDVFETIATHNIRL